MVFPNQLWLVGAGNMGAAMLARWIADGADPANIVAIDPGAPDVPTAGEELGLPADMVRRLAVATVEKAAALAAASGDVSAVLADRVARSGGTTRAGLEVLDGDGGMATLMARTLEAAARRSRELAAAAR